MADVEVKDIRYWKPWQPPDSTVMRRAREGLSSLVMISRRRLQARGVMSMVISLPLESLRGLAVMTVAGQAGVVEKGRRLGGLLSLREGG